MYDERLLRAHSHPIRSLLLYRDQMCQSNGMNFEKSTVNSDEAIEGAHVTHRRKTFMRLSLQTKMVFYYRRKIIIADDFHSSGLITVVRSSSDIN